MVLASPGERLSSFLLTHKDRARQYFDGLRTRIAGEAVAIEPYSPVDLDSLGLDPEAYYYGVKVTHAGRRERIGEQGQVEGGTVTKTYLTEASYRREAPNFPAIPEPGKREEAVRRARKQFGAGATVEKGK